MVEISVWVPDNLIEALDRAAEELKTNRSTLIRQALQRYVEDVEDLNLAVKRLHNPADTELNWQKVRNALLDTG
ncbi:MAG: ribbon-helix-helix protein, CopG family [Gemmatimonadota bacterium]|nr:ribbon-helix-helix protein, CopG family [Gemmatimonadota bacterium]